MPVNVHVYMLKCVCSVLNMLKRMFSSCEDAGIDGRFMLNTDYCFRLKGGYIFHYEYIITKDACLPLV